MVGDTYKNVDRVIETYSTAIVTIGAQLSLLETVLVILYSLITWNVLDNKLVRDYFKKSYDAEILQDKIPSRLRSKTSKSLHNKLMYSKIHPVT